MRVGGGWGDLYADGDVRWEGTWIGLLSAFVQGRGGAERYR